MSDADTIITTENNNGVIPGKIEGGALGVTRSPQECPSEKRFRHRC